MQKNLDITAFERGWAETLKRAIDVFITLISEGSQADREKFIAKFIDIYSVKYAETQKMLKQGGHMTQMSEGGTLLYIDYSRGKTLGALDIPHPSILKTEIYHQAFKVMGDELGRRFSTNLIKRNDLIELLCRSKTALEEVDPGLDGNQVGRLPLARFLQNPSFPYTRIINKRAAGASVPGVLQGYFA